MITFSSHIKIATGQGDSHPLFGSKNLSFIFTHFEF